MTEKSQLENRLLIAAPTGYDARNVCSLLQKEEIPHVLCNSIAELAASARNGVGALLLMEESLSVSGMEYLSTLLENQPPWSDVPLLLLVGSAEATAAGRASLQALGYGGMMTILERPLRIVTFISGIKAALRARRRQYQVRDLLEQRETILAELRERAVRLEVSQNELLAAKEKIARHAEELEQTVADRTSRLRETIAQLEAFSYSISHDMRGPLRAMRQYSEILLEDCGEQLGETAQDYLNRISRASSRLDQLIQDVLTYSRIAKAEMRLAEVDLHKLVSEIVQQYPGFQWPNAVVEVEGPLLPVIGHEAALTQCISNLLSNAVKFVAPGTRPHIRLRTQGRNGSVRLWVEDNGIGIARSDQQRIFNIFERVHSAAQFDGTGIGLAIVKKTLERMGGEVGLESDLGHGSRFWLELPQLAPKPICYPPSSSLKTAQMTFSS